ncbi:toxin-antitoxin system YwqK family antitoxin [Flavilitoribacter nigricans]|uniref:Toxin-antitoxin system YwqK family antitoxin n=1 Tax=Flavilitoribacter nigricans (strain ATCC 23147 / DSM 23189 / NBRC 102662 / NCIMB 1420 / SS-2) TaxID=1122177 RepID=A0A2D0NFY6_FLAN2|nr:toxin-antitoxin system YwqK family antitoxin [Flavilitoribacter nigricans]PHN07387.1 hypothetical protein CRP01_07085 [Flavilitoribacter nigricans DSM 23189 = NBRC 102662]
MKSQMRFQILSTYSKTSGYIVAGLLLLLTLFAACSGQGSSPGKGVAENELEVVEKTDAYGNTERFTRRLDNYAKEGKYSKMSPEGNLLETAEFYNDSLNGARVIYYENGDTQIVEHYEGGTFAGPYQAYYEGGQLELEGSYTANSMEGTWKRYYPSGQLMEEVSFQDNQENGPFVEYHENGKLKAEGYYKEGDNEHGLLKIYDETGELVKTMNCQHGVCRTVWEKEGATD